MTCLPQVLVVEDVCRGCGKPLPSRAGRKERSSVCCSAACRQLAAGVHVRRPGTTVHRAQVLDVLRIEGDRIVEITSFEPHLCDHAGGFTGTFGKVTGGMFPG